MVILAIKTRDEVHILSWLRTPGGIWSLSNKKGSGLGYGFGVFYNQVAGDSAVVYVIIHKEYTRNKEIEAEDSELHHYLRSV